MNHLVYVTKSDGSRELFEEQKLAGSLERAGASPEMVDDIVEQVERQMTDGMSTAEIYSAAFRLLGKKTPHVAVRYSIRRALADLGPDGFPFERYILRLFRAWGYDGVTDQTVRGACVEHEIDVVAWKDDPVRGSVLAMVEAKFHNELTLKSDLKVALYVKARFDDLSSQMFSYGGKHRKLTEHWLITNTKFTDRAIAYGSCQKLHMVGWNYPEKGSLHELIIENKLHPITCLTTLSHQEKKDLIVRDLLLCSEIINQRSMLISAGLTAAHAELVIKEARAVIGGVW